MFRGKTFQATLPGNSYRIFIEGLKSPVTKAVYNYALQKQINHLKITNPDDLLIHQVNYCRTEDQIVEYMIQLKNPPHSLRYVKRSKYLLAVITCDDLNDVALSKNRSKDISAKKRDPLKIGATQRKKYQKCLKYLTES